MAALIYAVFAIIWLAAGPALANPRPLPFTYQYETLPEDGMEIEQFVDLAPIRVLNENSVPVWFTSTQFQTEFEYGLTDKLELALYLTHVPTPSGLSSVPRLPTGNGAKQRLRYRLGDAGAWPIDVALYGEIAENDHEIELEGKIILQRRFGRLRVITNLWLEREYYFNGLREWVLNPTLGLTHELSPSFSLGLEGWVRSEYPDNAPSARAFNLGPHVYAGPTVLANFGRLWCSTGAYVRLSDLDRSTRAADFNQGTPSDAYGRVWIRTIIGVGF